MRPTRREAAKRTDAVKFVIDKVMKWTNEAIQQTNNDPSPIWGTIKKSLMESNESDCKTTSNHGKSTDMMQAPKWQ